MSESSNDNNSTKTRTAENTARRGGQAVGQTFSRTEGLTSNQSQINGIQGHIPNDQGTGLRRSGCKSSQSTSADPGKILEAVKLIEEKHLSYVKAHQQSLIARLDESKESENDFKKAIQELEAQIHQLISDKEESE